ncbi:VOC family protein [Bradyrhizobium liaoningense]
MAYCVLATNHTSFTVSDLQRSAAFFSECLGFAETSRSGRDPKLIEQIVGVPDADIEVVYLTGHGHVVELIEYKKPSDRGQISARPCDVGFAHLAFDVMGIDDLILAADEYGFHPVSPPVKTGTGGPNAGKRVCYMRDFDGVTIELIESTGG